MITPTAVAAVILIQIAFNIAILWTLFWHQKTLEWFRNHIRLENRLLPPDAPANMGREEDDEEHR